MDFTHRFWYLSLALETVAVCLMGWRGQFPMLCLWLLFDMLTGAISVAIDRYDPNHYQIWWETKQAGVILTRILAAREMWEKLGGRAWVAACAITSGFIYLSRAEALPHSVIETEFAIIAITTAALGMSLVLAVNAGRKLVTDPFVWSMGHVMLGYFLLNGLVYFVAYGYRDTIGDATGIVSSLAYGSMIFVVVAYRKRDRQEIAA